MEVEQPIEGEEEIDEKAQSKIEIKMELFTNELNELNTTIKKDEKCLTFLDNDSENRSIIKKEKKSEYDDQIQQLNEWLKSIDDKYIEKEAKKYWKRLLVSERNYVRHNFENGKLGSSEKNMIQPTVFLTFCKIYQSILSTHKEILFFQPLDKSVDAIRNKLKNKKFELILYTQFDGLESCGHWLLNIYVKKVDTVYVLNSMQGWKPKYYILKEVFKESKLCEISQIPHQTGVTCGYWVLYYIHIISNYTLSFDGLVDMIIGSHEYFNHFQRYVYHFCRHLVSLIGK